MNPAYDEAKFTELVLLIASRLANDRSVGETELNMVLCFADFTHLRRTGRPITGVTYQKLPHGPAPRRLRPVRDALEAAAHATVETEHFPGFRKDRLVPLREADTTLFDDDELATVEQVLHDLAGLTAKQVRELSFHQAGWQLVQDGNDIPYEAALVGFPQIETPTTRRLEQEALGLQGIIAR